MRISVLAVVVFGYLTCVCSHPTPNRVKRASSSASASSSSSSGGIGGANTFSSSSNGNDFGPSGLDDDTEGFGYGAGTRLNPFFPWGAFAGTFQPGTAGRIGSGCPGFGCGVQFGDFFPAFGQLFNGGYNGGSFEQQRAFQYSPNGFPAYNNYYDNNYQQYSPDYQNYYNPYPMYNNAQYNPASFRSPYDVGDFARMGPPAGGATYFPSGGSSSSYSSSSSNGNGIGTTYTGSTVNGISSRTATVRDPSGRVTTVQGGSGVPDSVHTRQLNPGQSGGIYSSSGVRVNPDGNVSSYRTGGQY